MKKESEKKVKRKLPIWLIIADVIYSLPILLLLYLIIYFNFFAEPSLAIGSLFAVIFLAVYILIVLFLFSLKLLLYRRTRNQLISLLPQIMFAIAAVLLYLDHTDAI